MKRLHTNWIGALRLEHAFGAFVLGMVLGCGSAYAGVSVEQSPLTLRSSLPPNIVLMHDDSGSMAWSVMPDNPPGSDRADEELINSSINGVYYNPSITYKPPYTKTAQPTALTPTYTRYPNASYTAAWNDGFDQNDGTENIALYSGDRDSTTNSISAKPRFTHIFRIERQGAAEYQYANAFCSWPFSGPNSNGVCTRGTPIDEPPRCQGFNNYDSASNACNVVGASLEACGSAQAPGAPGQANGSGFELSRSGNNWSCRREIAVERCTRYFFGFCVRTETVYEWEYEPPRCQGYNNFNSTGPNRGECGSGPQFEPQACGSTVAAGAPGNFANSENTQLLNDRCVRPQDTIAPSCPNGFSLFPDAGLNGEDCRSDEPVSGSTETIYRSYFVYMVPSGNGFVRHYVGVDNASSNSGSWNSPRAGTCEEVTTNRVDDIRGTSSSNTSLGESYASGLPANRCHSVSDDTGFVDDLGNTITVGQNVANWFSYYRKREYMAKSGLMNAFATLDPTIRFGFGSINSRNTSDIPSGLRTGTTPQLAKVTQFGNGTNNTQRSIFWDWLNDISSSGGTPLRRSLKTIGEYYEGAGPWLSGSLENPSNPSEELSCRQSYSILMTDGLWNGNSPSVGDVDDPSSIVKRTGPSGQCFEYPRKEDGSSCSSPPAEDPYVGSQSNTLADVAMKYWLDDLRPGAENRVPTSVEDPAFWQHMTTFTVGLYSKDASLPGVTPSGTTGDDIALWARNGNTPGNFEWPETSGDSSANIADLVHAGINGRGGFYSAGDPEAFQRGIQDALRRVQERVGTGASLAANSTRLDVGTTTYQSLYFSGRWRGDVQAFKIDLDTNQLQNEPAWSASELIPAPSDRTIKTCNPCGLAADTTVVELSYNNLSATQKAALNNSSAMVEYLRGDDSNAAFRSRDTPLGDIVNSQPVYVGAPDPNLFAYRDFTGSSAYESFANGQVSRDPLLWVAANDGMLHALDAETGVEVFAYLPNAVVLPHTFDLNNDGTDTPVNGIKDLASPNYGTGAIPHQYFNDGELTVADAYNGTDWKTVLVGTSGRGVARVVYALDITDPTAPTLLWERAAEDGESGSDWIGQTIGKPVIAQTSDGSWSALLGNGYNSDQNKAALLQFNLFTGALNVHTVSNTGDNGLAQPAVYIGDEQHNISTKAWAGDLEGEVWEFNLACTTGCSGTLRFADPGDRPITAGMLAGVNPDNQDVWIFFGTGKYTTPGDLADTSVQRWYGLIVDGANAVDATTVDSDLVERSIIAEQAVSADGLGARVLEEDAGEIAGKSGWFMALVPPASAGVGERMVTSNQFQGALLLGITRIPGSSDPCNPSGNGWIMAVNPFTGASPGETFFDLNGDSTFDDDDKLEGQIVGGIGFGSIPNNPIFVGDVMLVSLDDANTKGIATSGGGAITQRMSWRELVAE